MTISNIFDYIPRDIFENEILPKTDALTLASVNRTCNELVNELAQKFFESLSLSNNSVILDTLRQIPSEETNFLRLNSFCKSLKTIGIDAKNACKSFNSDAVLELIKTENDQALVSILPDIADAANLPYPRATNAKSAREWLESNDAAISQITSIFLSHNNNIRLIPPEIEKLTRLKHLHILMCDNLTTLPSEIGKLLALEVISVNDCKLMPNCQVNLACFRA